MYPHSVRQPYASYMYRLYSTEASCHIYIIQRQVTNVKASFCVYSLRTKFWYLLFSSGGFYNKEKLEPVLFL